MSHLDSEAVRAVAELVNKGLEFRASPLEPNVFYLPGPDGWERREVPLAAAGAEVYTTVSLLAMLRRAQPDEGRCMVLVGEREAKGVAEFATHRACFTLRLPRHPVYAELERLKTPQPFDQRSLIRLLASRLAGFIDPALTGTFRVITTRLEGGRESVVQPGRSGLSQDAIQQARAKDGTAIPESFVVECPVFDTPELRHLTCPVTVLLEETFEPGEPWRCELTVVHNQLANALDEAQRGLIDLLKTLSGQIPVYRASL